MKGLKVKRYTMEGVRRQGIKLRSAHPFFRRRSVRMAGK